MPDDLLVFAPLRIEETALPRRSGWTILRSGMGPARSRIAAARGLAVEARAVAVVGLCGAVSPNLRAGDVVCATELRAAAAMPLALGGVEVLASALRRRGLRVYEGPILSTDRILAKDERRALRDDGVLAVDMESAWLAEAADGRPFAVVRVVVEEADRDLLDPRTPVAGIRALRNLRRASGALAEWASGTRRASVSAYLAGDERSRPQEVSTG
jgi:4-hydroxy-3-methylbut-2-en-1-yl diphosphate reductase